MQPEFDVIDRVARAMTDAEPRGDFRVRVIARLPAPRPQPLWHYAAIACSGLVLGMLIMVGGVGRNTPTQNQTAPPAPAGGKTVLGPGRPSNGTTPISTGQRHEPTGPARPIGPTGFSVVGPVSPSEGAFQILTLPPIQPSDLSIAPIVVRPLSTGTLGVPVVDGNGRKK